MQRIYIVFSLLLFTVFLPTFAFSLTLVTDIVAERAAITELEYVDNDANFLHDGILIGVFTGNDSNQLEALADWLITNKGYSSDFTLSEEAKTEYEDDDATKYGELIIDPAVSLYIVKAGGGFALFELNPALSSITWNTYELWIRDFDGNGGEEGIQISHLTGYNTIPVPEPAAMVLLGIGLIGIAGIGRRTRRN
ncbi:MAG: PEP-CTERM sorting domain-containing protein [Desulfobacula sp.]|nr:PEP-CTERM sorting domain-containing protein [Desulfobacula sp.]